MKLVILFTHLFFLTCAAVAQPQYRERSPTTGPWKDQPPGTWIVNKLVTRDATDASPHVEYQREVLLGADEHEKPWFADYKSDSPSGPWTYSGGNGGGTTYLDDPRSKSTPMGEKTLAVGGRSILCVVTRYEMMDEGAVYSGEVWIDRATGMELQYSQTVRPRDADAPRFESVSQLKTIAIEERSINGRTYTVFVQESTSNSGRGAGPASRLVRSPDVPGQRVSFSLWRSADTTAPARLESELISWGQDLDALAEQKKRFGTDKGSPEDQLARFYSQTLGDAESDKSEVRARGLSTLAMNEFPPSERERINRVIRAGLTADDLPVRRAAAEAAGFQHVAGTAGRIVELSKADADGAAQYVRALGRLADPVGLDVVIAAAMDARGMDVSYEALANFSDQRATRALQDLLSSSNWITRSGVARQLGNGNNPHAAELLLSIVDDRDDHVRVAAIQALSEKADSRGLGAAIKAIGDPNLRVRTSAVMAVASIGQASGTPRPAADALIPLLDAKTEPQLRSSAALGLAQLKDPRALPALKQLANRPLEDGDGTAFGLPAAVMAIRAMAIMGTPDAVAALFELSGDPQREEIALSALRELKPPGAARVAWKTYRQRKSQVPRSSTAPATPEMLSGLDRDSEILSIVVQQADATLRDEIEASIASSAPAERPELRRLVRDIDEQQAATTHRPAAK